MSGTSVGGAFVAAQVLYDRVKQNADELSVVRGEILLLHPSLQCRTDASWLIASNNRGQAGLVPEKLVKKITEITKFNSERSSEAETRQDSSKASKQTSKRKREPGSSPVPQTLEHMGTSIFVPSLHLIFDLRMMLHRCNGSNMFEGIFHWLQLLGSDVEKNTRLQSNLKCWLHQLVTSVSIKYIDLPNANNSSSPDDCGQADFQEQIRFVEAIARIHREIALRPLSVARLIHLICAETPRTAKADRLVALSSLIQLSSGSKALDQPARKRGKLSRQPGNSMPYKNDMVNVSTETSTKKPPPALQDPVKHHLRPRSPNSPIHFIKA